jgi:hypothetical protein
MADKYCRITDGTTTINFNTDEDWLLARGGVSQSPLTDAHIVGDDPVAGKTIVRTFNLVAGAESHDELYAKGAALIALLRKAAQLHRTSWQLTPVWIEEKGRTESNPRYTPVLRAVGMTPPTVLIKPMDWINYIIDFGITLELGFPWQASAPQVIPTALTLTATDGPADDTMVHVVNFQDNTSIVQMKEDDGGAYTDIGAGDTLFPAVVAQDDGILWGFNASPKNIVIPKLATAGDLTTTTLKLYALTAGPVWTELTLGTDYTCFPGATLEECFEQNDYDIVINIHLSTGTIYTAIDGDNAHWIFLQETNAAPVYATNPVMHATYECYSQGKNYFEIGANQLKGDHPVRLLIRHRSSYGGGSTPGIGTTSRILYGAKNFNIGADQFASVLPAGNNHMPTGWAVTYGDDSSSVFRYNAPGSKEGYCDFGVETGLVERFIFTGTNMLQYYRGKYEVFVFYFQDGGDDEDIEMTVRFMIGEDSNDAPRRETETIACYADTGRYAVATMGEMELPFGAISENDDLATDLIIKVLAELTAGVAELYIGAVWLCPIDQWSGGLDDPNSDVTIGSSALRGGSLIDYDNRVILDRAQKFIILTDGSLIPGENWTYMGSLPEIEPATKTRIYMLQCQYASDWAEPPLLAPIGMHQTVEVFARPGYVFLRGDD